ncbi:MAG TPA: MFS transporter [Kineosporiaceae bacterium]|jgi:EmrB/QacA subfamily drug resistance transporter|nr:MFS transporter [Kineosporiaceae bacterium]
MSATLDTTSVAGRPPGPLKASHAGRRDRWVLATLGVAQLMVVLDATVVNIALPSAQAELGFDDGARQWVVTAYALAFGSLLLLGGRIGDLAGRARVFVAGLAGFAVASAVGGAAVDVRMLVAARAVQGLFAALLAPAALALLATTFTQPRERARAFAVFGAIGGGGASVGLLLGGLLTQYAGWRWTFYVNLVFAGVAVTGALALFDRRGSGGRPRLDVPGTVLGTVGLFALVDGFARAHASGWRDGATLGLLAAAAVLLAAFTAVQRHTEHPLLPPRVVADRDRAGAYGAVLLASVGIFGVFLFIAYYLQGTLGYGALASGLAFLPLSVALVAGSTVTGTVLAPRITSRVLVPAALLLAAASLVLLTGITPTSGYVTGLLPGMLLFGLAVGSIFAPAYRLATVGVRPADTGVAAAALNTAQQVGGAIGGALLNTVAVSAASTWAADHPGATAAAQVHAYTTVFWWAAAILTAGALVTALVLRPGVRTSTPPAG